MGNELPKGKELLLEFLDIKSIEDKIIFLQKNRDEIDEVFLDLATQCMDFVEKGGSLEERYYEFLRYLKTIQKYECGKR